MKYIENVSSCTQVSEANLDRSFFLFLCFLISAASPSIIFLQDENAQLIPAHKYPIAIRYFGEDDAEEADPLDSEESPLDDPEELDENEEFDDCDLDRFFGSSVGLAVG